MQRPTTYNQQAMLLHTKVRVQLAPHLEARWRQAALELSNKKMLLVRTGEDCGCESSTAKTAEYDVHNASRVQVTAAAAPEPCATKMRHSVSAERVACSLPGGQVPASCSRAVHLMLLVQDEHNLQCTRQLGVRPVLCIAVTVQHV